MGVGLSECFPDVMLLYVWQGSLLYPGGPVYLDPVSREGKGKARRRKECSYVTETGFYLFSIVTEPSFCLASLHPL